MFRAKRSAFPRGDTRILSRNSPRNLDSFAISDANRMAIDMYFCGESAINSERPTLINALAPTRPTHVRPINVTTGTPIHRESIVVVWPEKGNESKATSTAAYCFRYSNRNCRPTKLILAGATPLSRNWSEIRFLAIPGDARKLSREAGRDRKISAHTAI